MVDEDSLEGEMEEHWRGLLEYWRRGQACCGWLMVAEDSLEGHRHGGVDGGCCGGVLLAEGSMLMEETRVEEGARLAKGGGEEEESRLEARGVNDSRPCWLQRAGWLRREG